MGNTEQV